MELHEINYEGKDVLVLLDDKMRLAKPVYDYLKYLRLKERALNTLRANGRDLKLYWDFLNKKQQLYKEIKKLKEDKQNLIVQLVEMEELKDENKRFRENLDKIRDIK